jgi:hypothetical protein
MPFFSRPLTQSQSSSELIAPHPYMSRIEALRKLFPGLGTMFFLIDVSETLLQIILSKK